LIRQSFLTGLIGAPIAHSASPAMHQRAADALNVRCHYQLIEIAGASREELRTLLDGVRRLGFAGVNVTYPYKEEVVDLLDELSLSATAIGAVNTVLVREGRLIGHNTDATGFARAAANLFSGPGSESVAVIGAGGVGKAISVALAGLGVSEIRIHDTDRGKAGRLAALLGLRGVVASDLEAALQGATGVVNATPVGMLPNQDTPIPEPLLHDRLWVADAVYFPLWTPLLMSAKAKGARIMSGRELAIHQAVEAFHLFTGLMPSAIEMGIAFDQAMSSAKKTAARLA
jgi:shikimate dehydrogenase